MLNRTMKEQASCQKRNKAYHRIRGDTDDTLVVIRVSKG